jgi:DNA polymerase V
MSARVMSVLEEFAPSLEVYSIDEAFLDLPGVGHHDPVAYGQHIRKTVFRSTGIPVCVGMGPTKTLAKLANFAAKRWPQTGGVLDVSDPVRREKLMRLVPVGEVWGIGSRYAARLNQLGIATVWDLATQLPLNIQRQFNIVVARTVMELNGIPCLELEESAFGCRLHYSVHQNQCIQPARATISAIGQHQTGHCHAGYPRYRRQSQPPAKGNIQDGLRIP